MFLNLFKLKIQVGMYFETWPIGLWREKNVTTKLQDGVAFLYNVGALS